MNASDHGKGGEPAPPRRRRGGEQGAEPQPNLIVALGGYAPGMGEKIVGGMWCDYCQAPVAGQKPTSRARNTVAGVTVGLTGGLSLLGAKINKVYCPTCGQRVRPATPQDFGVPAPAPPRAKPTAERAAQLARIDAKKRERAKGTTRPAGSPPPRKRKRRRSG